MTFGFSHEPLVKLAKSGISFFYRKIEVYGSENVPEEGPIIFACTHTNMAVDPAILSNTIPHGHLLHYWVKDSLFAHPAMKAMLTNAGNIPVDRKTKNNQKLFLGTFEALAQDECIGVFPEGTSHTEPHLIPLKDGVSWTALEYLVYLRGADGQPPKKGKPAIIIPVGLAYCDKARYRSRVAVTYGTPITMDAFEKEFFSGAEGANKEAVKRLTGAMELEMHKMTVNAPDWDSYHAADMARELLWKYHDDLALADYVDVAQTLVDLLSTRGNEKIDKLKATLVTYRQLLFASRLSNHTLARLPLPSNLDPARQVPLPGRIRTLAVLIKDTIVCLIQFPFFILPFLFHIPLYFIGFLGGRMAEEELETQAQMKIFGGVFLSFITYPIAFFIFVWMFRHVPLGMVFAAGAVWLMGRYHAALIDQNYNGLKQLIAAWRVLVGVWFGPGVEMSLNQFIDSVASFAPNPPHTAGLAVGQQKEKYVRPQKLPSRVLVRHVLRQRVRATRELAATLLELEDTDATVKASFWLAERYGGDVYGPDASKHVAEYERHWPQGTRQAREIVPFLRGRGARIESPSAGEEYWAAAAAVTSGDEDKTE